MSWGRFLIPAVAATLMLEYGTTPLTIQHIPRERPHLYTWVSEQPPQVTLELPVPPPNFLPLHDPFYMYAQTWHWHPLANGYSGHYTSAYMDLLKALVGFPDQRSSDAMALTGIERVILHRDLFRPGEYAPIIKALDSHPDYHLETIDTDHMGEARVYAFLPGWGQTHASKND